MNEFNKFFQNKRIFITGHTGKFGIILCEMLQDFDAKIFGFSLSTDFTNYKSIKNVASIFGDVKDKDALETALELSEPNIIFHLAVKNPLNSKNPAEVSRTNFMGTLNLLELANAYKNLSYMAILANDEALLSINKDIFFKGQNVVVAFLKPRNLTEKELAINLLNVFEGDDYGKIKRKPTF